ncbi:DNA mismatch repair protein-like protein [Legionella santicrucis]|uniref:DNA mismatch repair protein-like protein n=1 Tax=Legionella santicrucis TaxID=45074 RepID=A0A0W0Z1I4_9GAMM|nr:Smr/MutS family protein [Legionella santicrucis]KTD63005.1 DNA mismatch repair protein-like protein [Legionella santicrucis]
MADNSVSDEDKALFRECMRSVKPLHEKTKRVSTKTQPPRQPQKSTCKEEKKEYYLSDMIIETVLSETILSYSQPSLSLQRFKALKKGQIPWEARLDLHGLKSENAREMLCQFIQTQAEQGKRCLLIIHGKGGIQGAPPVIKNLLNRWLPQINEVIAFHSALPKDGGSGAIYVFLKRKR